MGGEEDTEGESESNYSCDSLDDSSSEESSSSVVSSDDSCSNTDPESSDSDSDLDSDDEDTVEEVMDVNFAVPNPKPNRRGVLDPTTSTTTATTLKKSKTMTTGRSLHSRVSKLGSSLKSSILLRRSPQTKGPRTSFAKKTKPAATATATTSSFQQEQEQHQHQQEPRPWSQRPRRK